MRQKLTCVMVIIGLVAVSAWVLAEAPPEKAPPVGGSLPAGHPPMPGGGMPAVHPPMPGGSGVPAGHPPMPGGSGMPQGHPSMPGSGALPPADPDAPPPGSTSTLIVQATQGTPGGPAVKGDPVIVVLVRQGLAMKRFEATLDDKGQAVLENLPVAGGVMPVVTVKHGGIDYWQGGDQMHAGPPDHRVSVVVWESTEEPPPWSIRTRQILARRTEEGLYIKELMVVDTVGDKTWIGRKDADGKRATLELALSNNTGRADFYGGFVGSTTDLVNGRLVDRAPIFSGATQFVFGYVVPVTGGKASVEITCPADTAELAFAALDDGSKVSVKGLEAGEPIPKGKQKLRVYVAKKVKAGEKVIATLSGIPEPPPPPPPPPAPPAPKAK